MPEAVERPGLDQRLDGPLVEHLLGHPFGEVVERVELAVLVAFGEQQLDEPLPHVAHRRQTERDRARAADRRATRRRARDRPAIASKFMTERLMSGVSTLMPADRQSLR